MRRDQGFRVSPAIAVRGTPRQHHLQELDQVFRDLKIALVAGLMKGDQDFVG
jgi:hypothetical protein